MSGSEDTLGNTTKFSSGGDFVREYGSVALRFYLQSIARKLLPNERIRVCWRYPLPARKAVEIIYSDERQCARTSGTMKCGSGWVCPVCMRYIAERRRQELITAIERTQAEFFTVMGTFTLRHHASQRLKPLLADMVKAYGDVFSGRWWAMVREEYMLNGAIRATEITYGESGWHPHFHVLYFVSKAMLDDNYAGSIEEYAQSLQTQIGREWLEKLDKYGLSGTTERAFDVRTANEDIADYIAKWGRTPTEWSSNVSPYEIAYAAAKSARNGNLSVLELLFRADSSSKYKSLFLEYHEATKGKSQLHWSHGLKARLDIEVIRDEIAAEGIETDTDRILATVEFALWQYIAATGYLGQLMTYANQAEVGKLEWLLGRMHDEYEKLSQPIPQFELGH